MLKYCVNWIKFKWKKPFIGFVRGGKHIGEMWIEMESDRYKKHFLSLPGNTIQSIDHDLFKNGLDGEIIEEDGEMTFALYNFLKAQYELLKSE